MQLGPVSIQVAVPGRDPPSPPLQEGIPGKTTGSCVDAAESEGS